MARKNDRGAQDGWWITAVMDGPKFDSILADVELTARNISLPTTTHGMNWMA